MIDPHTYCRRARETKSVVSADGVRLTGAEPDSLREAKYESIASFWLTWDRAQARHPHASAAAAAFMTCSAPAKAGPSQGVEQGRGPYLASQGELGRIGAVPHRRQVVERGADRRRCRRRCHLVVNEATAAAVRARADGVERFADLGLVARVAADHTEFGCSQGCTRCIGVAQNVCAWHMQSSARSSSYLGHEQTGTWRRSGRPQTLQRTGRAPSCTGTSASGRRASPRRSMMQRHGAARSVIASYFERDSTIRRRRT